MLIRKQFDYANSSIFVPLKLALYFFAQMF